MNLPLFISKRLYSRGTDNKHVSRQAVTISTLAIALGLTIMIVTLGVVLGFKGEVRNKVVSFGSHIQVQSYESFYTPVTFPIQVTDSLRHAIEAVPGVQHTGAFCQKAGVLKTDDAFSGIVFKGIGADYNLDFLRKSLVSGSINAPFSASESTGRIVISKKMAKELRLQTGKVVYGYTFDEKLRARKFTVAGIYESGLNDFDRSIVFCDYHTVHQLLDYEADQAVGLEVTIKDFDKLNEVADHLGRQIGGRRDNYGMQYSVRTIREIHPNIFSWLNLLDVNVLIIFILMVLVAGFSTISGLFIIILERTQFIGVMKAMGSSNSLLRRIFSSYAVRIALKGMFWGNVAGIGLCYAQQCFHLVKLDAANYYVNEVPIQFNWFYIVCLNAGLALLIFLALLLPTLQVSRIQPAKSIRFE